MIKDNIEKPPDLQTLLDAIPAGRLAACLPGHDAIILHDGEKELGSIPFDGVIDVSLLDDSSVKKNYTITRSILLGPLVFLFPKKTIQEAYRLRIQWKDNQGDYHENDIRIPTRTAAEYRLNTIKSWLTLSGRKQLAENALKAKKQAAVSGKSEQPSRPVETSPFITCKGCNVEFRKSDLPPGGKCPVCGKRFEI